MPKQDKPKPPNTVKYIYNFKIISQEHRLNKVLDQTIKDKKKMTKRLMAHKPLFGILANIFLHET